MGIFVPKRASVLAGLGLAVVGSFLACSASPSDPALTDEVIAVADAGTGRPAGKLVVKPDGEPRTSEKGGRATVNVTLATKPLAPVVVPVTSEDATEVEAQPSSLTLGPDDWDKPHAITLIGHDDDVADGDRQVKIELGPTTSTDAAWNGIKADPIVATNADDDVADFEVGKPLPSDKTTEAGGKATFMVRLRAKPTADVIVAVTSTKPSEGKPDKSELVFTPASWTAAQTVVVTGVNDDTADGDVPYAIVLPKAVSKDARWNGVDPADVALVNQDDDIPGFFVSGPSPTNQTTEAGGAITFTVRLRSKPLSDVTIPVSISKTGEAAADVASLAFTPLNYDQEKTVTVTGKDDAIDDDDQPYDVVLGAATSADAKYAGLDPPDVSLVNKDDDVAAVLVSAPSPSNQTTEKGGAVTFTVRLATQPTAPVTIGVSSSKPSEGKADVTSLLFDAGDWNVPKTVTVTGQDDAVADGNVAYAIVLAKATSADAKYAAIDPNDVALLNVDDDQPGVSVSAPQPSNVTTEGGAKVTVAVVLQSQPVADVKIDVAVSKPGEATIDKTQLVFSAATWNAAQTITVTGKDDAVDDGDQSYSLVLKPALSADPKYANLDPNDVALVNVDDDTAGVTVSLPSPSDKTTETGGQVSFTVVLQSQPTADVTIPIASTKTGEGTPDKAQIVFQAATWNVPQTVTVTGKPDSAVDGDQAYGIALGAAVSGDAKYAGYTYSVPLTNRDACPFVKLGATTSRATAPQTADWGLGTGDWTVELWLKTDPGTTSGWIWGTNEMYAANNVGLFYDAATGKVLCNTYKDSCPCGPGTGNLYVNSKPVNDGGWHHVACVRSGGTGTMYTDGAAGDTDIIDTQLVVMSNAEIGKRAGYADHVAPAGLSVGPLRFSKAVRYAGAFTPATKWTVDASALGQYLSTKEASLTTITDEANGDNDAAIVTGITLGKDVALCR